MVGESTLCRRVKDSLWASGVLGTFALAGRHVFEETEGAANVAGNTMTSRLPNRTYDHFVRTVFRKPLGVLPHVWSY